MGERVVVEVVKVNIVHALRDVSDPSKLFLFGGSSQVYDGVTAGLGLFNTKLEVQTMIVMFELSVAGVAQLTQAAIAHITGVQ